MSKKPGDTNHSLREKKLLAINKQLKMEINLQKAKVEVVKAQLKETSSKLKTARTAASRKAGVK